MRKSLGLIFVLALTLAAPGITAAVDFTVNSTGDIDDGGACDNTLLDPHCTLREAIRNANSVAGLDTINFAIPVALPPAEDVLGGFVTPAGMDCDLMNNNVPDSSPCWWRIGLASNLPPLTDPEGVTINGFSQTPDANPGTMGSGEKAGVLPNNCETLVFQRPEIAVDGNTFAAFTMQSSNNTVRGISVYDTGTAGSGHAVQSESGVDNLALEMLIGTKPDGTNPMAERNKRFGVRVFSGSTMTVQKSFVAFNGHGGIVGLEPVSVLLALNNEVFQNGGLEVMNQQQDGIDLNGINGVARCNKSYDNETPTHIPNGGGGNGIEAGSTTFPGLSNNHIEYNTVHLNDSAGISVRHGSSGNFVEKNVVFENLVGISVNAESVRTNRNRLSQNSTFMNMELGIDLELVQSGSGSPWQGSPDDVTPNDMNCDVDPNEPVASNDLQNHPILTSAVSSPGGTTIAGTLHSTANTTFVIEFFATPDSALFGMADREGKTFLGSTMVTTGNDCNVAFSHPVSTSLQDDDEVTATATKFTDAAVPWSTSEYSNSQPVVEVCPKGKVTGGGHIQSPPGAFLEDPEKEGRANFGYNAKYREDSTGPFGHTNFVFKEARLHLSSTSYVPMSLLIFDDPPGPGAKRAEWKGEGKLNGKPGYCFKVNIHDDGQKPPQTEQDRFRIKIWQKTASFDCSNDAAPPIYDNDPSAMGTTLGGGNNTIHDEPCPADDEDDDDFDNDNRRDDEDDDDDNDGQRDDDDDDDDNDGIRDDDDDDDDNDHIKDEHDTKSHRERQQTTKGADVYGGQHKEYTMTADASTLLLIAMAEAPNAELLLVEIYDPAGLLVASSAPTPGRALTAAPALTPGTYTVRVRNIGALTVRYDLTLISRVPW
jgi:CSLREA domain-containing protein